MNQSVKLADEVHPLYKESHNVPSCQVDQQDLRLYRARKALRGLSGLFFTEGADDECIYGRRGDMGELLEIVREELEAGLTGVRPLL